MINLIKLLILLAYSVMIFLINDFVILGICFCLNIAFMFIVRLPVKQALAFILGVLPFIVFAAIINLFLAPPKEALLVTAHLLLACYAVICFRQNVTPMKLANAIETLCYPLKIFKPLKIDPKDISLMVCISITFIPILVRDFNQIKCALQAKGMKINAANMKYILRPFLYGIFKRTNEITNALKSKCYS
ncbi:hypothetical protein FACS1894190_18230 [Spirochaetia bacterium]|nr:hypothetical protein FACS1894190_18230 [Spirochaetia bacterium]GHV19759.1 hypothetical protein FACS189494_02170 [Spirochaetia bacterium]